MLASVYWIGADMNAILIVLPPLVFVLTVSAGIHLTNYFFDELRAGPEQGAILPHFAAGLGAVCAGRHYHRHWAGVVAGQRSRTGAAIRRPGGDGRAGHVPVAFPAASRRDGVLDRASAATADESPAASGVA